MKVGRDALDDEARRRIEELNPGVEFDWPKLLKGGGAPAPEVRPAPEPRRQRQESRRDAPRQRPTSQSSGDSQPSEERSRSFGNRGADVREQPATPSAREVVPAAPFEPVAARPAFEDEETITAPPIDEPRTAAHERLGVEGVQRLRARCIEIRARISERVTDVARREELLLSVERLNPDAWLTGDDVTSGLEQYEVVLASLREVVGRKRRRRKRGGGDGAPESDVDGSENADESTSAAEPSQDPARDDSPDEGS